MTGFKPGVATSRKDQLHDQSHILFHGLLLDMGF